MPLFLSADKAATDTACIWRLTPLAVGLGYTQHTPVWLTPNTFCLNVAEACTVQTPALSWAEVSLRVSQEGFFMCCRHKISDGDHTWWAAQPVGDDGLCRWTLMSIFLYRFPATKNYYGYTTWGTDELLFHCFCICMPSAHSAKLQHEAREVRLKFWTVMEIFYVSFRSQLVCRKLMFRLTADVWRPGGCRLFAVVCHISVHVTQPETELGT